MARVVQQTVRLLVRRQDWKGVLRALGLLALVAATGFFSGYCLANAQVTNTSDLLAGFALGALACILLFSALLGPMLAKVSAELDRLEEEQRKVLTKLGVGHLPESNAWCGRGERC